jgi:tRNA(fMet)-specific endonuclease VapC
MKYLFDTDTCISLLDSREPEKQQRILARLERLRAPTVCVSVITVSELAFEMENSEFRKPNMAALDTFLLDFAILPFDEAAAREAGRVRAVLEKKGQRIGAMDTLIAAHAKSQGLAVVTNNVAHFSRVRGLRVENWSV